MIKDITNIKDPLVIQIIQMLYAAPRNKQDIAKRTETNIDIVHRIYQYYFSSKAKIEDVKRIVESAPTSSIENKIEESDKKKRNIFSIDKRGDRFRRFIDYCAN